MPSTLTTSAEAHNENPSISETEFTAEFEKNRIEATPFQRFVLGAGSSIAALVDPHR